jgi:XTP/dITP diphosphohydrolase
LPVLADDSGLVVDGLGGEPGVHSAYYAGPHASDEDNNRKLVDALRDVPEAKRTARYVCHMTLLMPDGESFDVEEQVAGRMVTEARGLNGFGYDPLFLLPERDLTMAELTMAEKNQISHRARAIQAMLKKLQESGLLH